MNGVSKSNVWQHDRRARSVVDLVKQIPFIAYVVLVIILGVWVGRFENLLLSALVGLSAAVAGKFRAFAKQTELGGIAGYFAVFAVWWALGWPAGFADRYFCAFFAGLSAGMLFIPPLQIRK